SERAQSRWRRAVGRRQDGVPDAMQIVGFAIPGPILEIIPGRSPGSGYDAAASRRRFQTDQTGQLVPARKYMQAGCSECGNEFVERKPFQEYHIRGGELLHRLLDFRIEEGADQDQLHFGESPEDFDEAPLVLA